MPSARIEDYAMIGDCETAALVRRNGDIEWLCWPNFSSDACFASLLGAPENGRWKLSPVEDHVRVTRRYRPHTLILETTMQTVSGTIVLTDFMPIRGSHSDLLRIVECTTGEVNLHMELCPRFHYGSTVPWIDSHREAAHPTAWTARAGTDLVVLRTAVSVDQSSPGTLSATFTLRAGETQTFALTYGCSFEALPPSVDIAQELSECERFWTDWTGKNKYDGPYRNAVERSLITLKAMTYRPSGGIVAAPTTSLPERVGASLNWDYRYCWIRDATFTLSALLDAGYTEEVTAWKQWLLRAVGRDASQVQIMYGIGGERHIADWQISWLDGYQDSTPVRVGNAAQRQLQQDIYGEIAAALFHAREEGISCDQLELELQQSLTEHLTKIWEQPGSGMWEERNKPQRFTYSNVMAWLALDRAVKSIEKHGMGGPIAEWKQLREQIRHDVEKHGYSTSLDTFV
jgi:GH15 family glucan-1,4-alpha-glucosidase